MSLTYFTPARGAEAAAEEEGFYMLGQPFRLIACASG